MAIRVFLDSDVIISSIISVSGAAYALIHQTDDVTQHVSNISITELEIVVKRLKLDVHRLKNIVSVRCKITKLADKKQIQGTFARYTTDPDDTHVVAGAKESDSRFLITYNSRHFHPEKIKEDFGIIIMTPAQFLQYLRSMA
jgi:predicted nucleic acid-binding protein